LYQSSREKFQKSNSGELHPMYGKSHTEDSKEMMSKSRLGKKQSTSTIQKRVDKLTGIACSEEKKKSISEKLKGRKIINDGHRTSFVMQGEELPSGWNYGRISKSQ
jgi:hypothetical protein